MDLVITTNAPGEVSTWVIPFVKAVEKQGENCRVWVFMTPCMFSSGSEKRVFQEVKGLDGVFTTKELIRYILVGLKPTGFNPGSTGAVLCLGGDITYAQLVSKRLKYRRYAYCERAAGKIYRGFHYFVPHERVLQKLIKKGAVPQQVMVTGRLADDAVQANNCRKSVRELLGIETNHIVLNILPGSRFRMLERSIPLFFRSVENLPAEFVIVFTIAPYISRDEVIKVLNNSFTGHWKVIKKDEKSLCITIGDKQVILFFGNQYESMSASDLCVVFPGSNNMELAVLKVPTLVVLPLNYPERIPLPGIMEYICRIPYLGKKLKAKVLFPYILKKLPFVSPFNREMGSEIFPEMVGLMKPEEIENKILEICFFKLGSIREKLCNTEGNTGTSMRIASKIVKDLEGIV